MTSRSMTSKRLAMMNFTTFCKTTLRFSLISCSKISRIGAGCQEPKKQVSATILQGQVLDHQDEIERDEHTSQSNIGKHAREGGAKSEGSKVTSSEKEQASSWKEAEEAEMSRVPSGGPSKRRRRERSRSSGDEEDERESRRRNRDRRGKSSSSEDEQDRRGREDRRQMDRKREWDSRDARSRDRGWQGHGSSHHQYRGPTGRGGHAPPNFMGVGLSLLGMPFGPMGIPPKGGMGAFGFGGAVAPNNPSFGSSGKLESGGGNAEDYNPENPAVPELQQRQMIMNNPSQPMFPLPLPSPQELQRFLRQHIQNQLSAGRGKLNQPVGGMRDRSRKDFDWQPNENRPGTNGESWDAGRGGSNVESREGRNENRPRVEWKTVSDTILVTQIPENQCTERQLRSHFQKFGVIAKISIDDKVDDKNNKSAKITFTSHPMAKAAIGCVDAVFSNRFIQVKWAAPSGMDHGNAATQQGKLSQHADSGGRKIIGKAKGMNFVRAEGDANEGGSLALSSTAETLEDLLARQKEVLAALTAKGAGELSADEKVNLKKEFAELKSKVQAALKRKQEQAEAAALAATAPAHPPIRGGFRGGRGAGRGMGRGHFHGAPPVNRGPKAILISNLHPDISFEGLLRSHFQSYGPVGEIEFQEDKTSCVVHFATRGAASHALRHATFLNGKTLTLSWFEPPETAGTEESNDQNGDEGEKSSAMEEEANEGAMEADAGDKVEGVEEEQEC
uniref:RRM domain-containing protein n=1 Tax=Guillardia theta TaxID=55529 RepID=A0A7S4P5V1_GUITH|mmetsp:Transcript_43746/g.138266  ORF Transcript_43746/g.138266 Transcript_43746/m.138266 type:complete len:731 (+) Transcript_43746:255-2447(+)